MRPAVGETFPETNLLALLKLSEKAECEDRRDKVYGILGLASEIIEGDIAIDYTLSLFEVYCNVMTEFASPVSEVPLRRPLTGPPISELSQVLQKSLLRPDLSQAGCSEMANGRRAWMEKLLSSKVPQRPGQWEALSGIRRGVIIGTFDIHCDEIPEQPDASDAVRQPPVQEMFKRLRVDTRVIDMIWDLDYESFCMFEYAVDEDNVVRPPIRETSSGFALFVTDRMEVGLAPKGVKTHDILWEYACEGCLPLHTIVRNSQSNGPTYQVCGRAYMSNSNQNVGPPDLPHASTAARSTTFPTRKALYPDRLQAYLQDTQEVLYGFRASCDQAQLAKATKKLAMEVLVHLPVLQVLTCPLRSNFPKTPFWHGIEIPHDEESSEFDHLVMDETLLELTRQPRLAKLGQQTLEPKEDVNGLISGPQIENETIFSRLGKKLFGT